MTNTTSPDEAPPKRAEFYRGVAHDLARQTERLRLTVTGASMQPLLRDGDVVEVERVPPGDLRVGDIIVVRCSGEWVTHRLLAVDEHGWHTHGDGSRRVDIPAVAAEVAGRVVAVECGERYVDLQPSYWRTTDRLVGAIDRWKLNVLRVARGWRPEGLERSDTRAAALIAWPFQVLTRVLIAWSLRRSQHAPHKEG
jgi:hypothetical protein